MLLVNVRLLKTVDNPVPPGWMVMHDEYDDYNCQWCTVMGVAVTMTLLLNVFLLLFL